MGNEWEWEDGCEGVQGAEDIDLFRSTSCHAMTRHEPWSSIRIPWTTDHYHLTYSSDRWPACASPLSSRILSCLHSHSRPSRLPQDVRLRPTCICTKTWHHLTIFAFTLQNNILGFSLSASVLLTSRLFNPADLTFTSLSPYRSPSLSRNPRRIFLM